MDTMRKQSIVSALEELIKQVHGMMASGKYEEDEIMSTKDVSDVMGGVEDELQKDTTLGMPEEKEEGEEGDLAEEMKEYMKSKNLGTRPKGMKAVIMEAKMSGPGLKQIKKMK